MKIYVEKVLDEVVYFSTDYGNAKGIIDRLIRYIMLKWILICYVIMSPLFYVIRKNII